MHNNWKELLFKTVSVSWKEVWPQDLVDLLGNDLRFLIMLIYACILNLKGVAAFLLLVLADLH